MSLRKDCLENLPISFLNDPLEEVLSFKLLGLTICHDLSWESHISKLEAVQLGFDINTSSRCVAYIQVG